MITLLDNYFGDHFEWLSPNSYLAVRLTEFLNTAIFQHKQHSDVFKVWCDHYCKFTAESASK